MDAPPNNDAGNDDRPLRQKPHARQLDALIGRLESLPPAPPALADLLAAVAADSGVRAVLSAALAADVRLARSLAALAGCGEAAEAVGALGPERACEAALCLAPAGAFGGAGGGLDRAGLWRHAVATGLCARAIAGRLSDDAPAALAFACGLLHDLGKVVLDACLPKSYRRVLARAGGGASIAEIEREVIGLDHALAGRRLARRWGLPARVEEVIWLHHHPPDAVPAGLGGRGLIAVVQLADAIVRRRRIGFSGNEAFAPDEAELARRAGLPAEALAAVTESVPDLIAGRRELMDLTAEAAASGGGPGAPRPTVGGGCVPGDLVGLMGEFARRITPATPLPELCRQIARTFAALAPEAPPVGRVWAFAVSGEPPRATLAAWTDGARPACRVTDCRPDAAVPQALACPAAEALRPLLATPDAWSDLIDPEAAVCVPLRHRGRWLGGVLLPAGTRVDASAAPAAELMAFVLSGWAAQAAGEALAERLAETSARLAATREALAQAEAMAAVGEMAAGAAHEINTPLAVISGRAQMLADARGPGADEGQRRAAETIVRRAGQISDIATELLAFARPASPRPGAVDLAALLERVRDRAASAPQPKPPPPAVDIEVEPDCPPAWADAGQIEDVLVELVGNAAQAGAAAGREQLHVRLSAGRQAGAGGVLVGVTDDGAGMDEATSKAAFTPFFSRRPAGRGRGLGLPRARQVVRANGGRMWIDSRLGEGTTVFVALPRPAK